MSPTLSDFIDKKKLDNAILRFENNKRDLKQIVSNIVEGVVKERYPNEYCGVMQQHHNEIAIIRGKLFSENLEKINFELRRLYTLKAETYN